MASYSEIHKLEQRHRENPDGRTFAPLADAYRRAGRLAEAHQLVQAGLLKHPQYVSAHIVLGRCLIDMGDSAGARVAFEQVYALDSENIIALRMLSELAEGEGRLTDAEYWLRQALEVDPMNPDIRDGLERMASAATTAPPPEIPAADLTVISDAPEEAAADVSGAEPAHEQVQASPSDEAPPVQEPLVMGRERPEADEPAPEADDLVIERAEPAEDEEATPRPAAEVELDLELERLGDDPLSAASPERPDGPTDEPSPSVTDVEIERVSEEDVSRVAPPWMPVGIDAGSIVPYDGRIDFSQVEPKGTLPLDIEPDEPEPVDPAEADVTPVEGLAATQFESMELLDDAMGDLAATPEAAVVPPRAEPPPEEPTATAASSDDAIDLADLEMGEADAEAAAADAQDDLAALFGESEEVKGRSDSALADLPVFIPEEEDDFVDREPAPEEDYQAADHQSLDEAEPVVTETMAELLVSQGHVAEAIRVYQALLEARPGDDDITRRLATLEGRPAPSDGPTVGDLFRDLVAADLMLPEIPAEPEADDAPEASAPDVPQVGEGEGTPGPLSLDEVFGGAESATSQAPASPEPRQPAAASAPPQPQDPDEFSFDAFFGGDAEMPETNAEPGGDPETDLDEFQAWLRGLKS